MDSQIENLQGQYAGFLTRFIAYALDLVIAIAGISVMWWLINVTIEILRVRAVLDYFGWDFFFPFSSNDSGEFILRGFVLISGVGFYHVFLLAIANRTIGKAIMGLQVVPLKGGRIGVIRAIARYLGYIVSIIPFFLGFIWILFSSKRQGWHDIIARTCVVYTWEAGPDEVFLRRYVHRLQKANEKRFGPPPEIVE